MNTPPRFIVSLSMALLTLGLLSCIPNDGTRFIPNLAAAETPSATVDVAIAARATIDAALQEASTPTALSHETPTVTDTVTPIAPPTATPNQAATQTTAAQLVATNVATTLTALPTSTVLPAIADTPTTTPIPSPDPNDLATAVAHELATAVAATLTAQPTATSTPLPQLAVPSASLRLVYVHGNVGSTDISALDWATRSTARVASQSCDEAEPAWSPTGDAIIYHADCAGSYDIYRVNLNTAVTERVTKMNDQDEREPDYAPDGNQIVFRTNPRNSKNNLDGELWITNSDGSNGRSLRIFGRAPAWSPNGQYLAFMSERDGSWQIYQYDLQRETTTKLTNCSVNCRFPAWSPDGAYVAYHATKALQGSQSATADAIWYTPRSGGQPRQLVTGNNAGRVSWSNQGLITFNSTQGIEVIRLDGSARQVLIGSDENWAPIWSH